MANGSPDDAYDVLVQASDLIEEAILLVRKALRRDPIPEERRRLDQELIDLGEQSSLVEAKLDAALDPGPAFVMPTPEQATTIAELSRDVEQLRNEAIVAGNILTLTGRVLDTARQVSG